MKDRELLKLAAKAIGGSEVVWTDIDGNRYTGDPERPWNPLEDDGDALRLAVTLKMTVDVALWSNEVQVRAYKDNFGMHHVNDEGDDHLAATRRAIVRAAAEIGRVMP